jgi:hypothetical protein
MSLRKTANRDAPHAVFRDDRIGWTWRVLKTYAKPQSEALDGYARWMCEVSSPMTWPGSDLGDTYVRDVLRTGRLVECSREWAEAYGVTNTAVVRRD